MVEVKPGCGYKFEIDVVRVGDVRLPDQKDFNQMANKSEVTDRIRIEADLYRQREAVPVTLRVRISCSQCNLSAVLEASGIGEAQARSNGVTQARSIIKNYCPLKRPNPFS